MDHAELVKELARRSSVPEETAATLLEAVRQLAADGQLDAAGLLAPPEVAAELPPDDPSLVDRLIARAKKHPLGIEFLASGLLATVAITLGAHAFTVEAARRRLQKDEAKEETPA